MLKSRTSCLFLITVLVATFSTNAGGQDLSLDVGLGADFNTDAFLGEVALFCANLMDMPLGLAGFLAVGTGSQQFDNDGNYTVIRAGARGNWSFPFTDDGKLTGGPVAGLGIYRWSADYGSGEFSYSFSETDVTLDIGAGVQYGPFGGEVMTTLNGPNASIRAHYRIPLMKKDSD
jgi:hypothetical protein